MSYPSQWCQRGFPLIPIVLQNGTLDIKYYFRLFPSSYEHSPDKLVGIIPLSEEYRIKMTKLGPGLKVNWYYT